MVICWKFVDFRHTFTLTSTSSIRDVDKNMKIEFFYPVKARVCFCVGICFAVLFFANLFAYEVYEQVKVCLIFTTIVSQSAICWVKKNWWKIMLIPCNKVKLFLESKSVLSNDFLVCSIENEEVTFKAMSNLKIVPISHIRAISEQLRWGIMKQDSYEMCVRVCCRIRTLNLDLSTIREMRKHSMLHPTFVREFAGEVSLCNEAEPF